MSAMAILNFGSINIDLVYRVAHIVRPGETITARSRQVFAGGKGANQTMALARAGAAVSHAGRIGDDGRWVLDRLAAEGVDVRLVQRDDGPSGHAVIQVADDGENSIVIDGGANRRIDAKQIDDALARFAPGDWLVLQNEVSGIDRMIRAGRAAGLTVCFNPAPFDESVATLPLDLVDLLVVNEGECQALAGTDDVERGAGRLLDTVRQTVVVTLGGRGAMACERSGVQRVAARAVQAVDTTAAGDTFIGYLVAERAAGSDLQRAMHVAAAAAAVCVSRPGAMDSIPRRDEIEA